MRTLLYISIFASILLCLSSCQQDLNLDVDFESKLVINSTFSPDQPWLVEISKSGNILDENENIESLDDAFVSIKDINSSQEIELIHVADGLYTSNIMKPRENRTYELHVAKEGFRSIAARDRIMLNPVITDVDTATVQMSDGKKGLEISFDLLDESEDANYYIWDLIIEIPDPVSPDGNSISLQGLISTEDDNTDRVTSPSTFQDGHGRIFLSDNTFNGKNYKTSFVNNTTEYVTDGNGSASSSEQLSNVENAIYKLRVLSVSENLYEYYKTIDLYQWNSENNSNLSQPTVIHSNVNNGFGIFGAFNEQVIEIQ